MLGKADNIVPARRPADTRDATRGIDLLVRPERPPNTVLLEQATKFRDPIVVVLSGFAHVQGHVPSLTESEVLGYQIGFHLLPVPVKCIGKIVVRWLAKEREVGIPPRPAEDDQMVPVYLPNSTDESQIEGVQEWIEIVSVKVGGYGLVQ